MPDPVVPDLDVITLGMMMAEISPPRLGLRIDESEVLSLHIAGAATIFGTALARLGGRVGLISKVGNDQLGSWLLGHVRAEGIDTEAVSIVSGQLTPLLLASVDQQGNKTFAFYRFAGACDPLVTFRASEVADDYLRRARIFDLSEASLRDATLRPESLALARRGSDLGLIVCFSPNFRIESWVGGADEARHVLREGLALASLAIMNDTEAMLLARAESLDDATDWFVAHGPPLTVITRGRLPSLVIDDGVLREAPVFDVEVVYDIGAGDVFHAGYLAAWRPGGDPVLAASFAAAAAALKISRPPESVHMPTRAEAIAFLRQRRIDPLALAM
jgi:sugar/nucleoside kinase (ribokinase family)